MSFLSRVLSVTHILLAKSKIATYIAVKIRNQCFLILQQRFGAKAMDPLQNGEYTILRAILPHCDFYFDVGANKGEWTNFILENKKSALCKLYMYEPGIAAFTHLQKRFGNNDFAVLRNIALSDTKGMLTFYEEKNAGEMSSVIKGWANNSVKATQVICSTIDIEMVEKNIIFIDFLKIDTEGFDLKVIEGAIHAISTQKIGIIQFEYNRAWLNAASSLTNAYKIFNLNNYKVYLIQPKGLMNYNIDIYGEFYSFSNFLAVSNKSYPLIENLIM